MIEKKYKTTNFLNYSRYKFTHNYSSRSKFDKNGIDYSGPPLTITGFCTKNNSYVDAFQLTKKKRREIVMIQQIKTLHNKQNHENIDVDNKTSNYNEDKPILPTDTKKCINNAVEKQDKAIETTQYIPRDVPVLVQIGCYKNHIQKNDMQEKIFTKLKTYSINRNKFFNGKKLITKSLNIPFGVHFTLKENNNQPKHREQLKARCNSFFIAKNKDKNIIKDIEQKLGKQTRPNTADSHGIIKFNKGRKNNELIKNYSTFKESQYSNIDIILNDNYKNNRRNDNIKYVVVGTNNTYYDKSQAFISSNNLQKPSEVFQAFNTYRKNIELITGKRIKSKRVYMNSRPFKVNKTYCLC